jgi:hypothetical protein
MAATAARIQRGDGTIIREPRVVDRPSDAMGEPFAEIKNYKMPQTIGRPVINIDQHNQKIQHGCVGALDVRHWACEIEGVSVAMLDVKGFRMKTRVANPTEQRCSACDGSGVLAAIQPVQPGRRIYPPSCKESGGRGRIPKADN